MADQGVMLSTSIPTRDLGDLFRRAMRVSWLSENITGAGTTFSQPEGDAFTELDDDPPTFAVIALLGGRGLDMQKSAVHMHVWDRGDRREVSLSTGKALLALGVKARTKIHRFLYAVRLADPAAVVQTGS